MMNDQRADCPDIIRMESFLQSRGGDAAIARHLEHCPACRQQLEDLRLNNEVMSQIIAARLPRIASVTGTVGQIRVPAYEIQSEVHRGGQGIIYRAFHVATKRSVALKIILHGQLATSRQRQRFEREIELAATLRHPNIVTVYDSGVTEDGLAFLAMEMVEGQLLDEFARSQAAWQGLPDLLDCFAEICRGAHYAHQHGVIHRDLKPSNILVDVSGHPRILDFGLAKATDRLPGPDDPQVTVSGEFMGTLAYAAPEQLLGNCAQVDVRSDVYALGVILYELLTGQYPYPVDGTVAQVVQAITAAEPIRPRSRTNQSRVDVDSDAPGSFPVDGELETIVLKALTKDPERRYQSAEDLREDLRRYRAGEPIEAKRDSRWYVVRKTLHRHRVTAALGLLLFLTVAGFAVSMSILYRRAQLEADKAKQINIFLEDTLASVDASVDGHEVTVRELLDEAVAWIDIALAKEPEIAAALHNTVGNSYRNLRLYSESEVQLERALSIRRAQHGGDHPDVAQSLNALGLLRMATGDLEEADKLCRQALEMRRRLFGHTHLDVALSVNNLAAIREARGDVAAAEALLSEGLAIRQSILGDDHPDAAMNLFKLAELKYRTGDLKEAENLHRQALKIRRAALPDGHPDLRRSLTALSEVLMAAGRVDEAEEVQREADPRVGSR